MNLLQKSIEMSANYKENPKVDAVLLAGSVSKNLQDEHSDIELHILWSKSPTDEDRQKPIEKIDGTILSYHPYEDEEWSESYLDQNGVKFEISNFLSETVERFISDVVEKYETDFDKQCIIASINDGVSLFGEEKINDLKNRIATYPLELSKRMISEKLWLSNRWNNRKGLLKRKDWLMLSDVICGVQKNLLGVLFGLNHLYVHHPVFKWMEIYIEEMEVRPESLHDRMTNILIGHPQDGIEKLEKLIEEVIELVERHHPELDITDQKKHIGYAK
ncbi:DUF4037 domain-containing protein [Alkalihalobacillus macyae]|uniref:DUF4037 domain-containing protein n=1 Tax=Guptibacillus hwajinpoensis TaxID=208199 RepID=UPI00273A8317|nr:DUF4037 domain-containing protein [Alkalihalobacillus macyae]MDP4549581.1 DUF4037 domain-containing protein [Alkalihalobacillus macyae]